MSETMGLVNLDRYRLYAAGRAPLPNDCCATRADHSATSVTDHNRCTLLCPLQDGRERSRSASGRRPMPSPIFAHVVDVLFAVRNAKVLTVATRGMHSFPDIQSAET